MGDHPSGADWKQSALQHIDALYGFARVLCGNPSDADELVQDTFLRALAHGNRLEPGSNVKGWLFVIMRNQWLKYQRAAKRLPASVSLDDENESYLADETYDPASMVARIWERRELRDAIEKLEGSHREVIFLRDIEGFSYREVADILDVPMGTVMSRLARARGHLRRYLTGIDANMNHPMKMSQK